MAKDPLPHLETFVEAAERGSFMEEGREPGRRPSNK